MKNDWIGDVVRRQIHEDSTALRRQDTPTLVSIQPPAPSEPSPAVSEEQIRRWLHDDQDPR